MRQLLVILFSQALVNNFMLSRILGGTCPFIGVSQQVETATGMSLAVVFVMTVASAITWLVQNFILNPLNMAYLQTVAFILVIAALVQLIEMVIKNPAFLYRALAYTSRSSLRTVRCWAWRSSTTRPTTICWNLQ